MLLDCKRSNFKDDTMELNQGSLTEGKG